MASKRKSTPATTESSILLACARRCCLCFHLYGDLGVKHGQIAHLDRDPANTNPDNLAFMCLAHHSEYDSKTSQHKNFTIAEAKAAKNNLTQTIQEKQHHLNNTAPIEVKQEASVLYPETSQLLQETLNLNISLVTLLRKSKQIAIKIGDADFEKWATQELDGYTGASSKDLPFYRKIYGELKSFNPYRGWEPVQFKTSESRERCSFAPVGSAVGALEKSLTDKRGEAFTFNYAPDEKHRILSAIPGASDVQLVLPIESLDRILDAIRNQLYEWLLRLQR